MEQDKPKDVDEQDIELKPRPMHTIIVRNVPHSLYEAMWNLRKRYGANSWKTLFEMITTSMNEEIESKEWI